MNKMIRNFIFWFVFGFVMMSSVSGQDRPQSKPKVVSITDDNFKKKITKGFVLVHFTAPYQMATLDKKLFDGVTKFEGCVIHKIDHSQVKKVIPRKPLPTSKDYKKILNHKFVEDDFSLNKKNVFKGFHGDHKTWKLVSCVYGKCEAVIVNFDKKSNQFGMWEKFILSPNPYFQILIPPSYGNSFLVLSN